MFQHVTVFLVVEAMLPESWVMQYVVQNREWKTSHSMVWSMVVGVFFLGRLVGTK